MTFYNSCNEFSKVKKSPDELLCFYFSVPDMVLRTFSTCSLLLRSCLNPRGMSN